MSMIVTAVFTTCTGWILTLRRSPVASRIGPTANTTADCSSLRMKVMTPANAPSRRRPVTISSTSGM